MTRLIVITGFVIAFAAGLMAGIAWKGDTVVPAAPGDANRTGSPTGNRPPGDRGGDRGSWIAQQLGLTPEQQQQMKQIWSEVSHRGGREARDKRGQIRREQEEAIAKLVREEDRPAYQKIIDDSKAKVEAIEADGKRSFEQAVAKTKAILSTDQLKKYEEILAKPPGPPDRDRNGDRATTQPTTTPSQPK
jgi:Spy/CpxP family protein refolding chaperone